MQSPALVAADAAGLRTMTREIPRKWQLLDALTAELGRLAGVETIAKRPDQQVFRSLQSWSGAICATRLPRN
ncbi:MAG: hypothetical protein ACKOW1_08610 [Novosphingobium sp.]